LPGLPERLPVEPRQRVASRQWELRELQVSEALRAEQQLASEQEVR